MVIYADVVFLLNVFVDVCILLITAVALKRRIKFWRLFLGAIFGSSLALLILTPLSAVSSLPVSKIMFSFIIILISFGYVNIVYFTKNLLMFYFSTFLFGGSVIGSHYLLQSSYPTLTEPVSAFSSVYGDPISWIFVSFAIPILFMYIRKQMNEISFTKLRYDKIIKVEVEFENFQIKLDGLIDNGNQLCDPLTGKPIVIITKDMIMPYLPIAIINNVSKPLDVYDHLDEEWKKIVRVVPIKVVGSEQQWIITIKANKLRMYQEEKLIEVQNVLLGINEYGFTDEGEFQCILHPKLLVG